MDLFYCTVRCSVMPIRMELSRHIRTNSFIFQFFWLWSIVLNNNLFIHSQLQHHQIHSKKVFGFQSINETPRIWSKKRIHTIFCVIICWWKLIKKNKNSISHLKLLTHNAMVIVELLNRSFVHSIVHWFVQNLNAKQSEAPHIDWNEGVIIIIIQIKNWNCTMFIECRNKRY